MPVVNEKFVETIDVKEPGDGDLAIVDDEAEGRTI